MSVELVVFLVLAATGTFSAAMMVTRRNPVHSVLYLLVTFFSVAAVYVLLHAEFVAVVQVLVYAGGIMVLFLFVVLLVDVGRVEALRGARFLHHGRGEAERQGQGQGREAVPHRLREVLSVRVVCRSVPDQAHHGDLHVP